MNAMFKHEHAGVHHQHHYVSHLIHNSHFWIGVGITLLVGMLAALVFYAVNSGASIGPTYMPFGPYGYGM